MPKFKQFGAPAVLNSGLQYICMEIVQANHLPSSDDNGYTDAFFTVEWEGMVQKTKVTAREDIVCFLHPLLWCCSKRIGEKDPPAGRSDTKASHDGVVLSCASGYFQVSRPCVQGETLFPRPSLQLF